jgi:hypothetical protein
MNGKGRRLGKSRSAGKAEEFFCDIPHAQGRIFVRQARCPKLHIYPDHQNLVPAPPHKVAVKLRLNLHEHLTTTGHAAEGAPGGNIRERRNLLAGGHPDRDAPLPHAHHRAPQDQQIM